VADSEDHVEEVKEFQAFYIKPNVEVKLTVKRPLEIYLAPGF